MKRSRLIFLITIVLFISANLKAQVEENAWQDSTVVIDGLDEDWKGVMRFNSDAKIMYGLSNDDKNLYIKIKVDDEIVQKKILLTGLTFWMDTVGKKKKQFSITCPVKRDPQMVSQNRANRQQSGQTNSAEVYKELINSKFNSGIVDMEVSGFKRYPGVVVLNNKNDNGINVVLHINSSNEMIWEALIPLKMIFPDPGEFLSHHGYFSFGVETGYIDFDSMSSQSGTPGRGRGGKGGGGGGRGMGSRMNGGQSPGANPERMQMMKAMGEPSKFKVKKASFAKN